MKTRKTTSERYTQKGLKLFACWLPDELVINIRVLALRKGMKIADLIASKFTEEEFRETSIQSEKPNEKVLVKRKNNK
jgi:hypothetical protein